MSGRTPSSPFAVRAGGVRDALRRARSGGRRPRPRTVVVAVLAVTLVVAGWLWLRDSSLVGVRDVSVTGIAGPQAADVRSALEDAARSMTTLHVRRDALDTAVAPFSVVKRIEVATDFPRGMRIHVVTNVAVGAVVVDGRRVPVTSDGTLLRDVKPAAALPSIPVKVTPGGSRLTEPQALAAVAALGAAPPPLRRRVGEVTTTPEHGLTLALAHGPELRFGDRTRLAAKWAAAAAVLADAEAAGATYVDVTAPERPAVGGLPDGAPATGESDVPPIEPDASGGAVEPGAGEGASGVAETPAGTAEPGESANPQVEVEP